MSLDTIPLAKIKDWLLLLPIQIIAPYVLPILHFISQFQHRSNIASHSFFDVFLTASLMRYEARKKMPRQNLHQCSSSRDKLCIAPGLHHGNLISLKGTPVGVISLITNQGVIRPTHETEVHCSPYQLSRLARIPWVRARSCSSWVFLKSSLNCSKQDRCWKRVQHWSLGGSSNLACCRNLSRKEW